MKQTKKNFAKICIFLFRSGMEVIVLKYVSFCQLKGESLIYSTSGYPG